MRFTSGIITYFQIQKTLLDEFAQVRELMGKSLPIEHREMGRLRLYFVRVLVSNMTRQLLGHLSHRLNIKENIFFKKQYINYKISINCLNRIFINK